MLPTNDTTGRFVRRILGPLGGLACLLLIACGSEEADPADELGLQDPDSYELVIIDEDQETPKEQEAPEQKEPAKPQDPPATQGEPERQPPPQPKAAAKGKGGPVAVAPAADEAAGTAVRFDPKGQFTVQIGLYRDAKAAAKLVRQLADSGYPVYAISSPDGKGVRVRIGYFSTRQQALRFGAIFKEDRGFDFWVDRRANETQ